jgi:cytochrome b
MKTMSASLADSGAAPAAQPTMLVWDLPVRVFHWLMVLSFAGAYLTAESERWRLVHVTLGYTMVGLVVFRLAWGLVGSRYARFANFVRGPAAVVRYVRSLISGRPEHHVGHNPAGALAIVALMGLTMAIGLSGWSVYNDIGGVWSEELHELAANTMLAVIGVHIAGVLLSSLLHRENLAASMITGRKSGRPEDGVRSAWRSVATLMLIAVLGFWWLQWQDAAPVGGVGGATGSTLSAHDRDDD